LTVAQIRRLGRALPFVQSGEYQLDSLYEITLLLQEFDLHVHTLARIFSYIGERAFCLWKRRSVELSLLSPTDQHLQQRVIAGLPIPQTGDKFVTEYHTQVFFRFGINTSPVTDFLFGTLGKLLRPSCGVPVRAVPLEFGRRFR
jgi:hypothetical protein